MENLLIKFKTELKQIQRLRKETLKKYSPELKRLNSLIEGAPESDMSLSQIERWFPQLYYWLGEDLIKLSEFYRKRKLKFNALELLYSMASNILQNLQNEYGKYQEIINACDNEKIICPIFDFNYLLSSLELANLTEEETRSIFGMFISYCSKYLQKYQDAQIEKAEYIAILGHYFKDDGNFKYASNVYAFSFALEALFKELIAADSSKEIYIEILNSFVMQLKESNEKTFIDGLTNSMVSPLEVNEEAKTIKGSIISKESRDKLRKYYKNGILIQIPESIDEFNDLLIECGIDDVEKRYILGLVTGELRKIRQDKLLKYLSDSDKTLYQEALDLLRQLKPTDPDYASLLQIITDLNAASDILKDAENEEMQEYAFNEIDVLISSLGAVLAKYTEKETVENNILFLCNDSEVPYLKVDSDELEGGFYKMVCNGIKKITKENQTSFGPVYTLENVPFRLYDITASKVHIVFIELDNGIYLLVGVKQHGQGYDDLVRRVINNETLIKKLESLLKDENTRNELLTNHKQYLSLFNPLNPNEILKRS